MNKFEQSTIVSADEHGPIFTIFPFLTPISVFALPFGRKTVPPLSIKSRSDIGFIITGF